MNNKWIIISFFCLLSLQTFSQRVIQMEYDGGVYKVPCIVNGANMKMIFDTGASTVCISRATAIFLYQNGYITSNDFKGTGYSSTASGAIVDHMKINLRDIEIGGMHLRNIEGVVMESLTAPLLLGQSAIQKLGSVTIRGNQLVINNGVSSTISKGQTFKCNGYIIDSRLLIRELQMGFSDYMKYKNLSYKDKTIIANYVDELIVFIRNGECYFELRTLQFYNSDYPTRKRTKNEQECLSDAAYYVSKIAMQIINRGDYIDTY